jgi:proline iminopeptidase
VERWLVRGGSWGSTLALAYAERHPERVTEVILTAVAITRRHEVEWITRRVGRLFPEQWARFRDGVPEAERYGDDWCHWEDTHVSVRPDHRPDSRYDDPRFRMTFARLVTHYWRHAAFLEDGALLAGVDRLAGDPGIAEATVAATDRFARRR